MPANGEGEGPFFPGEPIFAARMNEVIRGRGVGIADIAPPLVGELTPAGWILSADSQRIVIFKKTSDTADANGLKPGKIYRFEIGTPTPVEVEDCLIWELP